MAEYKRLLPCYAGLGNSPNMVEFTGFEVGSFFIHRGRASDLEQYPRGNWTVTHSASGYSVQKEIPSKRRAMWLAKSLEPLCDWWALTPECTKELSPDVRAEINALRAAALVGGSQAASA